MYYCENCNAQAIHDAGEIRKSCACKKGSIICDLSVVCYGKGNARDESLYLKLTRLGQKLIDLLKGKDANQ